MKTLTQEEYDALSADEQDDCEKVGDKWVMKSHLGHVVMRFTNTKAKGLKWSATASDAEPDYFGDRCTPELFANFVSRAQVTQNYGYVSIAHHGLHHVPETKSQLLGPDTTAGVVEELFLSENRLRARGHFHNTPIGTESYRSILKDHQLQSPIKDRVRISIGFYDYKHSHDVEGETVLFDRSKESVCVHCAMGSPRTFIDGELIHLALTRIPANPRTPIELETEITRSAVMFTRKDDAASIIGEDLAEALEEVASEMPQLQSLVTRSENTMNESDLRRIMAEVLAAHSATETPKTVTPLDTLHDQVLSSKTNEELNAHLSAYAIQAKSLLHQANPAAQVAEELKSLNEIVRTLSTEIATLKSTPAQTAPRQPIISTIPTPTPVESNGKPMSIREAALRSVGLQGAN